MKKTCFTDICTLIMGQSPDSSSYNTNYEGLPFYQGNSDFGELHPVPRVWCSEPKKIAQENDILISVRAPIGDLNIANEKCCIGRGLAAIRIINSDNVDLTYLYHFFESKRTYLQEKGTGSTFKAINKDSLINFVIPLPSIKEQESISQELFALHLLIKGKKTQLFALDELVKSRFIEMFGEPLVNEYNFPKKKLSDTFLLSAGGTPKTDKKEYWDNGTISWIGSNMCQNQILYQNDGKYITELGLKNSSAKIFDVDTVLIALVGATIGKTALLKFPTATNQNVLGIQKIANAAYNPYFVYYYMQGLYDRFIDLGDGKFKMASKGFVGDLEIFVVDLHLQNEFAEFVKLIDKSKFIVQQQIKDLQELLDSKMDEYFR